MRAGVRGWQTLGRVLPAPALTARPRRSQGSVMAPSQTTAAGRAEASAEPGSSGSSLRPPPLRLPHGHLLDEEFSGLADEDGLMTIAGFGSLLSEASARSTFPNLKNFRLAKVPGWRRVFAHTCDIFYARGIARHETLEVSSLSVEEHPGAETIITLFEVEATPGSIKAFIEREHEFRFVAVEPLNLDGTPSGRTAVMCARWNDEEYRRVRCPPEEWHRRYGKHGVTRIWRDDVLPCRVYLRHCVLSAEKLGPEVLANFLDATFLGDRSTTVRLHLERDPSILEELPPPELVGRYSG